jgi:hypothetical protein
MATSSFGKAFRAARDAGETEFEFNGKKYNTKYKEEVKTSAKPAAAKPAPVMPDAKNPNYSNEGRGMGVKPTPSAMAPAPSGRVPTSEQASANRQAAMDKVKGFGSGVMDAISNFETPAERRSREAKEASGMKHGGSVKKMASGGNVSSASKRADGIAQKGKTRGKMC